MEDHIIARNQKSWDKMEKCTSTSMLKEGFGFATPVLESSHLLYGRKCVL
jgi:hypothetical protein